jgi:hypothetical protein
MPEEEVATKQGSEFLSRADLQRIADLELLERQARADWEQPLFQTVRHTWKGSADRREDLAAELAEHSSSHLTAAVRQGIDKLSKKMHALGVSHSMADMIRHEELESQHAAAVSRDLEKYKREHPEPDEYAQKLRRDDYTRFRDWPHLRPELEGQTHEYAPTRARTMSDFTRTDPDFVPRYYRDPRRPRDTR